MRRLALLLVLVPAVASAYDPAGRRDPFAPFVVTYTCPPIPGEDPWNAGDFVVTGVITGEGGQRALLVDPKGEARVVRLGSYVGMNWGKVTAITAGGVTVTEEYQTIDGEPVVNTVFLALPT
jgi:Tfp pilus assembly protein PilP